MLWGGSLGGLEVRKSREGGFHLRGTFPYGARTTLSDGGRNGGRPRKEEFAPRAFAYNVEREDVNIMFLSGHRWDKPLASRKAGTLKLQDSDDALTFDAVISTEVQETSWARDFMAAFAAGLVLGLSPGFRLPPQRTVKNAETIKEEDPAEGNALIRVVNHALLWEVSAVTKAAYEEAQIEARNWTPDPATRLHKPTPAYRWRA